MRSMRTRLVVAFSLVALLAVVATGVMVDRGTARDLRERARDNARARMDAAAQVFDATGRLPPGVSRGIDGAPPQIRDAVPAVGTEITYDDGRGTMWAARRISTPGGPVALLLRTPLDENAQIQARLRRLIIAAGVAAVLAAILVGVLLARRLSARLQHAAAVATRVAGGELAARVGDRHMDEIGRLSTAVDDMSAALSTTIDRERRFSANVAHELRTPIQALVSAGELLGEGRAETVVREQVQRLRTLVEDLLEVFRLDSGIEVAEPEVIDTEVVTRRAVERSGVDARVRVVRVARAWCDPRRVERVIANLVVNAHRHGGLPIDVTVDGLTIRVRDHGPGFPEGMALPDGEGLTEGGHRAPRGLGLTIAARQARIIGASIRLSNAEDGGAQADVTLTAVDESARLPSGDDDANR